MASDAEAPSKVEIVDDNAPAAEAAEAAEKSEVAAPAEAASKAAAAAPKYSKAEKKARKAILKLGLKEIPGVFRVTLKRNPSIVIHRPEVYKSPTSDTYVIFGEPKLDDNQENMAKAAQQLAADDNPPDLVEVEDASSSSSSSSSSAAAGDDETFAGFTEDDVKVVVDQSKVDRAKAIAALKKTNGDIVSAILELSSN
eukprot:CAMPEP_0184332584 /NCGR_PEP_ID=MMETSP1089-20130417/1745_1 /TAXON_ID=38269 ORGANISM="Gloeochaete wittrockiana, Strain SAG46.84" /NCGR_SAMPLE_ID=MMETSP1089 /ASSEMBLY_ACC=CAM_ASM_000445 /LENGTH=197 /DNA_ID=CAMNT_0026656019 /DNA_START=26 /DNA_END=619 /DNA_ORIENTATION=-